MILSAIVAAAENNAIGRHYELPWHLPDDFKFFKRTTMGKPVLMGRKTFESLGKPLPGRLNIVISRSQDVQLPEGVLLCNGVEAAIELLQRQDAEEGFVIGGGEIFAKTMHLLDRIYLTRVHTIVDDATAFFPDIDHTHWKLVWHEDHAADDKHVYAFTFQQYERIEL